MQAGVWHPKLHKLNTSTELESDISIRHEERPSANAWVGVKNFGFTEEQKNIEQGSIKLKELHVCIMRVQKKMAAWRSEVP